MIRTRVTPSEKKQCHEWAVRQIDTGMGLSELTVLTAETWGCSRNTPVMSSLRPMQIGLRRSITKKSTREIHFFSRLDG